MKAVDLVRDELGRSSQPPMTQMNVYLRVEAKELCDRLTQRLGGSRGKTVELALKALDALLQEVDSPPVRKISFRVSGSMADHIPEIQIQERVRERTRKWVANQ